MSASIGAVYNSDEIAGIALGENNLGGAAFGQDVFWERPEKILYIKSSPTAPIKPNVDFTVVLSTNRQTTTIMFFNENSTGLGKTLVSNIDTGDGNREFSYILRVPTTGTRNIYAVPLGRTADPGSVEFEPEKCTVFSVTAVK